MIIRRIEQSDLATRVEWMNCPAIYSSMHFDIPVMLDRTLAWYKSNLGNPARADMVALEDGEIVAFCGITGIDPILKKGESYTFVNPYEHHKGIGTKARTMLLDYAFGELGLNKVYCYTNEDNLASIHLSERLGFALEGRFRKEYLTADGTLKDRLYFGLLKEDWIK